MSVLLFNLAGRVWLSLNVRDKMKTSPSLVLLTSAFSLFGCAHSFAFEDEYIRITKSQPALFAHLDTHVSVEVKGTSFSFSGVDFGSRPYYLRVPDQNALLVLTWTDRNYDLVFHFVDLTRKTRTDIPGGHLYFGQHYGSFPARKEEASVILHADGSAITLVALGETIAEGRYKEITVLDLKGAKVRSTELVHLPPENQAKKPNQAPEPTAPSGRGSS
jgi:hypothetical protein